LFQSNLDENEVEGDSTTEEIEPEVRHVTQMAYLSWPDHGVPDNPEEFVQVNCNPLNPIWGKCFRF